MWKCIYIYIYTSLRWKPTPCEKFKHSTKCPSWRASRHQPDHPAFGPREEPIFIRAYIYISTMDWSKSPILGGWGGATLLAATAKHFPEARASPSGSGLIGKEWQNSQHHTATSWWESHSVGMEGRDRQTDKQAGRQAGKQTNRQTDRQTAIQTYRQTYR